MGVTTPMALCISSTMYTLRAGRGGRQAGSWETTEPYMRAGTAGQPYPAQTQTSQPPSAHPPVLVMVHQLADGGLEGGLRAAGDQRGARQRLAPPALLQQHTCQGKQVPLLLLLLALCQQQKNGGSTNLSSNPHPEAPAAP